MGRRAVAGTAYHRGPGRGTMLGSIIDAIANVIHNVWLWFQTILPGGFGLILLPLIVLGVITILVSRNR